MKKAFLFDLDGTLVDTGGAGRSAMTRAFEDLFHVEDPFHGDRFSGKTDPVIFHTAAVRHFGREPTVEEEHTFYERYLGYLKIHISDSKGYRVLPGVVRLLDALGSRSDCLTGLCTGNLESGARIKLERGGLNRFFDFGGFGSDSGDRTRLTKAARDRAEKLAGCPVRPLVLGDSPLDFRAAKANGYSIALVATGWTEADVLEALGPDHFFESFEDTRATVDRLLSLGSDPETHPDPVSRAADIVRSGGVIIHPTSTLYGFGGDASSPDVLARIGDLKGGRKGPFICLAADGESALALARTVSLEVRRLADRFWPGPLTLVLPAKDGVLPGLTAPDGSLAVRVDSHPFALALVRAVGRPLVSTSANRSGEPPPALAADVDDGLVASCDLLIEDDAPIVGIPSTVVRVTRDGIKLLREGAVSFADIEQGNI